MQGYNPYAAGHKTYGFSNAAHRGGGLDPMGYIERTLNRGLGGNDSQQRSGHAAGALAKLGMGGSGGGKPKKKAAKKSAPKKRPGKVTGQRNAPGVIDEDNLSSVSTPIISSATGQLTLDPDLMQETAEAEEAYNSNRISLDQLAADLLQQYTVGQRDLGVQQEEDKRSDLNRYAGRGMAFSSGYGDELAQSSQMFGNAFSDLSNQFNMQQQGIGQQRLQNENFLTGARQRIAARQAALNTENAGTLGLDPGYTAPRGRPMPQARTPRKYSVPGKPAPVKKAAAKAHGKKKGKK